jgi:hypothetical protein
MPGVPPYMRGRDVTAFTLVPQTVAADGTFTAGTSKSLAGTWEEVDIDIEPITEEISSADAVRSNNMILKEQIRIRCTQILKRSGATANELAALMASADYFLLTLTRGPNTWAVYVLRAGYSESIRAGKSVATATFIAVDTGSAYGYT